MSFDEERHRMVEVQLRARGMESERVFKAMEKVPRHRFVSKELEHSAYGDHPLPIGEGQTISQPYMVALMTECMELEGNEKVLEIGTGSGYQAAILAQLGEEVYSIERVEKLSLKAKEILAVLGYTNVKLKVGDGTKGWEEYSPYQAVIVTAGSPDIPQSLFDQLSEGGRMVIPVGGSFSQELMVVRKKKGKAETKKVCGCVFVPLIGEFGWKE